MASVTKIVGAAESAEYATGDIAWTGAGNVTADDGTPATCTVGSSGRTQFLKCTMAGNEFAIPAGSRINGYEVSYKASTVDGVDGEVFDLRDVRLVINGEITGLNLVDSTHDIGIVEATFTVGGATQKFGIPATVGATNGSAFGVALRFQRQGSSSRTIEIEYVAITPHYTEGAGDVAYAPTGDAAVGMMHALSRLPTSGRFRMMFPGFGAVKVAFITSNRVAMDSSTVTDEMDGSADPQTRVTSKMSASMAIATGTEHMRSTVTSGSVLVNRGVFHNGTVSESGSFLNVSGMGEDADGNGYVEFEIASTDVDQQVILVEALSGTGVQVAMGNQTGLDGTTNATARINPGFVPDLNVFLSGLESGGSAHTVYAGVGFGLAYNPGTGNANLVHRHIVNENRAYTNSGGSQLTDYENLMRVGTDRCHWHRNYGADPALTYSLDTLDYDESDGPGFTIRSHGADGTIDTDDGVSWLALKFPAGFQIAVGDFVTPTSTGEKTFGDADLDPDIPFAPTVMKSWWSKAEALDTIYEDSANGDAIGIFADRDPIAGSLCRSVGNGTTTAQDSFSPAALHLEDGDLSTLMRATPEGFVEGGWAMDFTDVDATPRYGMYLAMAPAASAGASAKYTSHALSLMGAG